MEEFYEIIEKIYERFSIILESSKIKTEVSLNVLQNYKNSTEFLFRNFDILAGKEMEKTVRSKRLCSYSLFLF